MGSVYGSIRCMGLGVGMGVGVGCWALQFPYLQGELNSHFFTQNRDQYSVLCVKFIEYLVEK